MSTHRRFDGRRLDMIAATSHDKFADKDYRRLSEMGIGAARDGLRWHIVDRSKCVYDFSTPAGLTDVTAVTGYGTMLTNKATGRSMSR